ncbi:MAG: DUF4332 domain-containing protein [Spirochaetales bacterium]|nr:DUF4332 domain-containing protein [Spirochaetales bacterium]
MNNKELNNIKINDLFSVLGEKTLTRSYWNSIENLKNICTVLPLNSIKDSNDLFLVMQNDNDLHHLIKKTKVDMTYVRLLFQLLQFHKYKPYQLKIIIGVDKKHIEKLKVNGIKTNGELLLSCSTKEKSLSLQRRTEIPKNTFHKILALADLFRKPGIKEIKADLFMHVGIMSLFELGKRDPDKLRKEMERIIEQRTLKRAIPTEKEITSDIYWAKIYPRIIGNV